MEYEYLSDEIVEAIKRGDLDQVRRLVEEAYGAIDDPDITVPLYTQGLSHALDGDHYDIAEFFIEKGANVNGRDEGGLSFFTTAAIDGRLNKLRFLIEHGADPENENDVVLRAVTDGRLDIVKVLLDEANLTPDLDEAFFVAMYNRRFEIAEFLLNRGADIHTRDDQSLINAVSWGDQESIQFLVEHGADVNARRSEPLRIAIWRGHYQAGRYLILQGADVESYHARIGRVLRGLPPGSSSFKDLVIQTLYRRERRGGAGTERGAMHPDPVYQMIMGWMPPPE